VLARGFALVRSEAGRPLRAAAAITPGMRLDIELADGRVRATAEARSLSAATASEPPLRRKARRSSDPGQGTLF
jgi:exodeoxyribonuclease VII large subunit